MGNWQKLKEAISKNSVNVQKHPLEEFCEKAVLKNFSIFIGKHLSWIWRAKALFNTKLKMILI